jgi:hypothetical protein
MATNRADRAYKKVVDRPRHVAITVRRMQKRALDSSTCRAVAIYIIEAVGKKKVMVVRDMLFHFFGLVVVDYSSSTFVPRKNVWCTSKTYSSPIVVANGKVAPVSVQELEHLDIAASTYQVQNGLAIGVARIGRQSALHHGLHSFQGLQVSDGLFGEFGHFCPITGNLMSRGLVVIRG